MYLKRIATIAVLSLAALTSHATAQSLDALGPTETAVADRLLEAVEIAEASGDADAVVAAYAALRAFVPEDPIVTLGYGIALVRAGRDADADGIFATIGADAPTEVRDTAQAWRDDIATRWRPPVDPAPWDDAVSALQLAVADAASAAHAVDEAASIAAGIMDQASAWRPPLITHAPHHPSATPWWIATGVGVVTTTALGLWTLNAQRDAEDRSHTRAEADALYDDARTRSNYTNVALATTVLLAGVSLWRTDWTPDRPAEVSLTVTPHAAVLGVRF